MNKNERLKILKKFTTKYSRKLITLGLLVRLFDDLVDLELKLNGLEETDFKIIDLLEKQVMKNV